MKQKDEYLPYIEWNEELIKEWLSDKFTERGLVSDEYVFITKFIRDVEPEVIIDVGTFLGKSGYILGTSSPKLKYLYALDHHEGPTYTGPYKGLVKTDDYGKYLPDYCIFKTYGYEKDLEPILLEHIGENIFIFFDAGKSPIKIWNQVQLSYQYHIPYIGFHDTLLPQVRRNLTDAKKLGMYEVCAEKQANNLPGLTILRII